VHYPTKERRTHVDQKQTLNTTVIGYGRINCSAPRQGIDLYTVSWLTFSEASERTTIRHRHNPL